MMTTIIPDTCSLINLSDVFIGGKHITDLLNDLFNVQIPTEIPREVRRHKDSLNGYEARIINFVRVSNQTFNKQQEYERQLRIAFNPACNPNKNRGERYSCSLALYQNRKRISGPAIVLSDDMSAYRGFINWFEERFRATKFWTSLDLLVYIYLVVYPKYPLAQAILDLRKVNARMGGADAAVRLLNYRRYINNSHSTLQLLPKPKVRGIL